MTEELDRKMDPLDAGDEVGDDEVSFALTNMKSRTFDLKSISSQNFLYKNNNTKEVNRKRSPR